MRLPKPPKRAFVNLLLICLPAMLAGCADFKEHSFTGRLWENGAMIYRHEPAPETNLRLFADAQHSDFLALYDEGNEKNGDIQPRAYFLGANETRVEQRRKPRFVDPKLAEKLPPIPLQTASTSLNAPPGLSAKVSADSQNFTLYQDGRELAVYRLPTYADKGSEAARILLTPATAAADTAMAASVVGGWGAYMYAAWRAGATP